jgi:hypothetical protein
MGFEPLVNIRMKKVIVHRIFSTPLIQFKFDKHQNYQFPNLEKTVKKPDTWTEPLNTSFPNIRDDDSLIGKEIRDSLKNDLLSSIKSSCRELNLPDNIVFQEFWYNAYHDNQGQEKHWHMPNVGGIMPYWCGIYYNKNSSPTVFYKESLLDKTHWFSGYDESKIGDCKWDHYYAHISDGDVLLFPPYLWHSVKSEDKHKNNMRLTFSFNLNLK